VAAATLSTIAADRRHLGAEIGFVAVLHTWGQNLQHHPHVHCLVPGGGLAADGTRWVSCRPGFFLSVRVLSRLFRRLFLEKLREAFAAGKLAFFGALAHLADARVFDRSLAELRRVEWVVYAKRPFAGPAAVLAYLGRYTHRVAIANSRLVALAGGRVSFRRRDYRHQNKSKVMTLAADEFIRRFLLHALPDGFHRIRHYGFLSNRRRAEKLALCRTLLAVADVDARLGDTQERGAAPITRMIAALAVAGGWSRSALSRDRGRQPLRPGTTAHDRCALANDHHIGGPVRDSDSGVGPLRRERRRRTHSAARAGLPPLVRRRQAAVRRGIPPIARALPLPGVTATLAALAFNSP
jgi:hypothetical protein